MLHHARADVEQVDLNIFKIGPLGFQESLQDGKRLIGLLRDLLAEFGIAEVEAGTNDENPFCRFRKRLCRRLRS